MSAELDVREVRAAMAERLVVDVNRAGEILLGEAQRRAPIEEGTLSGSASLALIVNGQRFDGTGALAGAIAAARAAALAGQDVDVAAEVSFNTVYASSQHEGLDYVHPKGGEAKYLERPLGELAPRLTALIAAGQSRALG